MESKTQKKTKKLQLEANSKTKKKKAEFELTRDMEEKLVMNRQYEKDKKERLLEIRSEREEKEEMKRCVPPSDISAWHKRKGKNIIYSKSKINR